MNTQIASTKQHLQPSSSAKKFKYRSKVSWFQTCDFSCGVSIHMYLPSSWLSLFLTSRLIVPSRKLTKSLPTWPSANDSVVTERGTRHSSTTADAAGPPMTCGLLTEVRTFAVAGSSSVKGRSSDLSREWRILLIVWLRVSSSFARPLLDTSFCHVFFWGLKMVLQTWSKFPTRRGWTLKPRIWLWTYTRTASSSGALSGKCEPGFSLLTGLKPNILARRCACFLSYGERSHVYI